MHAMRQQGVLEIYCRIFEDIYPNRTRNIRLHADTVQVLIVREIRQGDKISFKLFMACLQEFFNALNGRNNGIKCLSNIRCKDGFIPFSEVDWELRQMIEELNRES